MASTSIQYDRVNESVITCVDTENMDTSCNETMDTSCNEAMDTLCDEASNEITAPAVSSLTKCTRTKVVVSLLMAFVIVVITCICVYVAFKHSGDGNSDTQASAHGTEKQTGSGQERTDPDKHLLRYSAEGVLCKEIIKPYIANELEKSDSSTSEYIHNSSCLLCNGTCKHPDAKFICNGSIQINNCNLKRDMKNKDEGVCGGAGKYVCYSENDEPQCKCDNDMKVGELCQNDTKVPCKCWTSKLAIADQENPVRPLCLGEKPEMWTLCTLDLDHDFKCVCNNTISGALPDCTQARTETQTGTNTGSNVHALMDIHVLGVIMLILGYHYYVNEV